MSPTAVMNRWSHLVEKGLAWTCTYPNLGRRFIVVVEVDRRTEFLPSATRQMYVHSLITSVDEATGRRDILLTIIAPNMAIPAALITDWIGGIDGVYGTCSSLATNVIVGTEFWRANILTQRQVNQAFPQRTPDRSQTGLDVADLTLAQALARDGRAGVTLLSQELGISASTVHCRMRRLLANQHLIMRRDTAPELAGWLLECTWPTAVAFNYRNRVTELLKEQPSLRSCLWITGDNNLRVNFHVSHIGSMVALESSIAFAIPGLTPDETVTHMRSHRSMGWLLRPDGDCTGQLVPPVFGL